MENIWIALLAIFGLSFLIKESSGPFDIMSKLRNYLMRNKYVGYFFYSLLSCYFCVGCHSGWIVYLLFNKNYTVNLFIIWMLAGGASSLILEAVLNKLNTES